MKIRNIFKLSIILFYLCGCARPYSLSVVDCNNQPVSFAEYRSVYIPWGRDAMIGEGHTDVNGHAIIKSRSGANVYVLKDGECGWSTIDNASNSVSVCIESNDVPEDVTVLFGREADSEEEESRVRRK